MAEIPTNAGVWVALTSGDSQVSVVVAGTSETLALSRLFEGPLDDDGGFDLTTDAWSLSGGPVPGEAFAVNLLDPDGLREPEFTLRAPIDPSSIDGPYRGDGPGGCTASAVVFNSGGQAQGVSCANDGSPILIEAGLGELTQAGAAAIEIEVDHGDGPAPLRLEAILPDPA